MIRYKKRSCFSRIEIDLDKQRYILSPSNFIVPRRGMQHFFIASVHMPSRQSLFSSENKRSNNNKIEINTNKLHLMKCGFPRN